MSKVREARNFMVFIGNPYTGCVMLKSNLREREQTNEAIDIKKIKSWDVQNGRSNQGQANIYSVVLIIYLGVETREVCSCSSQKQLDYFL